MLAGSCRNSRSMRDGSGSSGTLTGTMTRPEAMLADYDREMLGGVARGYYDGSDFYNYGYWLPDTRTQREASENLVEKLLSMLPRRTGCILDAACGIGGSTRYLTRHFEPADVSAVNLSAAQVGQAHRNAPECSVAVMDAVHLGFGDGAFDSMICVESAFHFDTREAFFKGGPPRAQAGRRPGHDRHPLPAHEQTPGKTRPPACRQPPRQRRGIQARARRGGVSRRRGDRCHGPLLGAVHDESCSCGRSAACWPTLRATAHFCPVSRSR